MTAAEDSLDSRLHLLQPLVLTLPRPQNTRLDPLPNRLGTWHSGAQALALSLTIQSLLGRRHPP